MKAPDQLACKLKYAMVEGYEVMRALLDDTGRIRVPDRVQADLGVKVGDELAWEEENGRWFLEAAGSKSAGAERALGPDDVSNSVTPRDRCTSSAVASDCDELNREEMDYESLPLRRVGQVRFRIKRRGRLQPMPHDLDEE
jgi:bifunctional DNA-binding transcriptional regulator/antitoxin component of YhaV-PrlF toxin-antitoxin module